MKTNEKTGYWADRKVFENINLFKTGNDYWIDYDSLCLGINHFIIHSNWIELLNRHSFFEHISLHQSLLVSFVSVDHVAWLFIIAPKRSEICLAVSTRILLRWMSISPSKRQQPNATCQHAQPHLCPTHQPKHSEVTTVSSTLNDLFF